jgi:hypothetical protein
MTRVSLKRDNSQLYLRPPKQKLTSDGNEKTTDVLRMIVGNTKWVLDFYHFIVDELFDLADEFEPVFSDSEAFAQKGGPLDFYIPKSVTQFYEQRNGFLTVRVVCLSEIYEFISAHTPPFEYVSSFPALYLPRTARVVQRLPYSACCR